MGGNKYYCRINGIIYNLKMIQDIIDKNPEHLRQNIYMVLTEEYQISDHIADLLSEIVEGTKKIPTDYNEALKEYQARDCKRSGIPEGGQEDSCSKSGNIQCRSANTSKHTGDNKYYCRIDGALYDLKKIQDIIDANPKYLGGEIDMVLSEEYHIPDPISYLLADIIEETKEIPADYNEALKEYQARNRKRYGIPERFRHSEGPCIESDNIQCKNLESAKYTRDSEYICRIEGVLYDLKKIQDIIDANPKYLGGEIDMVLSEEYHIPDPISYLLADIIEETKEIPADYNEALKEYQARNRKKYGIPERFRHSDDSNDKNSRNRGCPRCGSTYISKPIWSLYDYKCKTCGHEWVRCPRCGGSNIKIRRVPPVSAVKNSLNKCKDCGHDWRRM